MDGAVGADRDSGMARAYVDGPQPDRPMPELEREMQRLNRSHLGIAECITELENVLATVMGPENVEAELVRDRIPPSTSLGLAMSGASDGFERQEQRLHNLIARLRVAL